MSIDKNRRYAQATLTIALLFGSAVLFCVTVANLKGKPRPTVQAEIEVALPLFVQVFMMGGDRYLAANLGAVRALVTDTFRMRQEEFGVLAKVQEDVSWLNPAHEDNYYVAAAILPWNGQVDSAQRVLANATKARPYDYQPGFYYAFDKLYFQKDPVGASKALLAASETLPLGDDRLHMQHLSVLWAEKGGDPDLAIRLVKAMAANSNRSDFRRYLLMRADRLQLLKHIRSAVDEFKANFEKPPESLNQLVSAGLLKELPTDPFGFGFDITTDGTVELRNSAQRK